MELLFVIGSIGFMAGIAMPLYGRYQERVEVGTGIADMIVIEAAIDRYQYDRMERSDSLAEVGMGNKVDPWGKAYVSLKLAGNGANGLAGQRRKHKNLLPINTDFDLSSMGEDGMTHAPLTALASHNDIVRADNDGYFGLASKY